MSRHGMVPRGGRTPGPGNPRGVPFAWKFALRILLREALLGAALWACAPAVPSATTLGVGLTGLVLAILWARRFGLLRPRCWAKAFTEGLLLYVGGVCLANVVLLTLGNAPWAAATR